MKPDVSALASTLPQQRWFGDKRRTITGVELLDHGTVDDGPDALVLAIVAVSFSEGGDSLYSLPLLVADDGSAREASEDPERLAVIAELLAHGHPIKGERGVFHFSGAGLDPTTPPAGPVRVLGAEQSNTSIVFGESVILKLFRKVERGPNPDIELTRLLTNEGFDNIPPQLGEIFYGPEDALEDAPDNEIALGIAQRFVGASREGWTYVLEELDRLFDEVHPQDAAEDRMVLLEERGADLLVAMSQLGEATGALHVALSREEVAPELRRELLDHADLVELSRDAIASFRAIKGEVPELVRWAPDIEERLRALSAVEDGGAAIRVHGDYHLGQVLRTPRAWLILDFEGEPARPLEERRAKRPPLKDVAGMLRSFSYAVYASLFARAEAGDDEWVRLEPWALAWEALARERFLAAYLTKSHEGRFLPQDRDALIALLDLFELDKALYEVRYELGHRPDWLRIPLHGIQRVLDGGAT